MEKREIKYRGIAVDTGQMITGYGVIAIDDIAQIIHAQGNNIMQHTNVIRETIGEYTGLKDKAGVEIFEGDILEVDYTYRTTSKHTSPYVDKLVCRFTNGAFNFFYKGIERVLNVDTTVYSVIGNIHQHPELCSA